MPTVADFRRLPVGLVVDEAGADRFIAERRTALAAQTVRFAVAPWCALTLADGSHLRPGDEVTEEDLEGTDHVLWKLVRDGRVLDKEDGE